MPNSNTETKSKDSICSAEWLNLSHYLHEVSFHAIGSYRTKLVTNLLTHVHFDKFDNSLYYLSAKGIMPWLVVIIWV